MKRLLIATAALLFFSPGAGWPDAFPHGSVTETTLPNGLRVVVKQNAGARLTSVSVWIHAGSRNESEANNGVAHLLEHFLFSGGGDPDRFDREIEGLGGVLNAETARDDTHFYAVAPSESWKTALGLLGQMLQKPTLDPARMELERHRVTDEVEGRGADPGQTLRDAVYALAFTRHPYRLPAAGSVASVQKLGFSQVQQFFQTYYHPENASLIIVGSVSPTEATAAARDLFGSWERASNPPPAVSQEPLAIASPAPKWIPLPAGTPRAVVAVGFPAPSVQAPRDAVAMDVLYTMLTTGQRSLIGRTIPQLEEHGSDYLTQRDPGLFILWGTVPADGIATARKAIQKLVQGIGDGQFSDDDLDRARQQLLGSYALESETSLDQNNGLGFYDAIASYEYAVEYEDQVRATTRADLQRVAGAYRGIMYSVVMAPPGAVI